MFSLQVVDAVDNLLCALEQSKAEPFGGKMIIMGGDWKQLLPVVREAKDREVLNYTLRHTQHWDLFQVRPCIEILLGYLHLFQTVTLTKNMRVGGNEQEFANFLDCVGRHDDSVHACKSKIANHALNRSF